MKVTGVKYVLDVREMDRAVKFYADTFDLAISMHAAEWSELSFENSPVLGLHPGAKPEGARRTGLSFTVDDLDEAVARVHANGGKVHQAPFTQTADQIRLASFIDPEGNLFMASQAV